MKKAKKKQSTASLSTSERKRLKNRIWYYLKKKDYKPLTQKQLFKNLGLDKKLESIASDILTNLIQSNEVIVEKNKLRVKPPQIDSIEGIFFRHPKGFGFVSPKDSDLQDVFIPKPCTLSALNQDSVKVRLSKNPNSKKGPEGVITEILKRGKNSIVGIIYDADKDHFLAFCPTLGDSKIVGVTPSKKIPLATGDRVLLEITNWEAYPFEILTNPVKIIGHISDASKDIESAIYDFDLRDSFSKEIEDEVKKLPKSPLTKDLENRADLTDIETFTIDPDTAKDFDDALSLTKEKNSYKLIVHIADVSHYVKEGSLIDNEAILRCNSTYFPSKCLPMLPEKLSNGLCSLKENVLRLTASVFMEFNKKGELKSYDIKRSYIKSQKRYTYKEAKKILDGELESPHKQTLVHMRELCHLLQAKRRERGSVDFAMDDLSLKMDKKGNPIAYEVIEYDITHQVVEEFMLKANEVVAKHLSDQGIDLIYRTHEPPSDSDIEGFYQLARALGFKLKLKPKKGDVQGLFEKAASTPHLHQLCLAFIRSMKLAIYSENNVGHFGLSLEHYCHFTSPIRRYSDLIVHRILFTDPIESEALKKVSKKLSDQERVSFRAESSVNLLKKLRYLDKLISDNPDTNFDAFVTKIKPFGIYFELSPLQFEGFVHISDLGNEYFRYSNEQNLLCGERTNMTFKTGSKIKVVIDHLSLITGETHFRILNAPGKKKRRKK